MCIVIPFFFLSFLFQALYFYQVRGECGDIGQSFQLLLAEINKTDTQYLLRIANRLFGENLMTSSR
jgi:hypothetical protein